MQPAILGEMTSPGLLWRCIFIGCRRLGRETTKLAFDLPRTSQSPAGPAHGGTAEEKATSPSFPIHPRTVKCKVRAIEFATMGDREIGNVNFSKLASRSRKSFRSVRRHVLRICAAMGGTSHDAADTIRWGSLASVRSTNTRDVGDERRVRIGLGKACRGLWVMIFHGPRPILHDDRSRTKSPLRPPGLGSWSSPTGIPSSSPSPSPLESLRPVITMYVWNHLPPIHQ